MLWARHRCDEVRRDLALNERLTTRTAETLIKGDDPDVLRNLLVQHRMPAGCSASPRHRTTASAT